MFRKIRNVIASLVRHATVAQRLDDAVTFADGQCELVSQLQAELANTYRRIDALRTEAEANRLQVESFQDHIDVITDDNAALRRSLAEMRTERDALKNELATLRAATTPRTAGYDSDPYDGLSPADRR